MTELFQIVDNYLNENGIRMNYFADYIGCECSKCCRWLKGTGKLNPDQLKKTHEFLSGKHIKTVEQVMGRD